MSPGRLGQSDESGELTVSQNGKMGEPKDLGKANIAAMAEHGASS